VVSLKAAQRGNVNNGGQTLQVKLDGQVVGTFTPVGTSYASYQTAAFAASAGAHTLSVEGLNPLGGDNTAFVDEVRLLGPEAAQVAWLVSDHLGTPRINVRGTGADGGALASVTRHDYLPFGEEIQSTVGGRSSVPQGYAGDAVRQQFTGYERDAETGLDFAQARYYSSAQGRFTSPDPLHASGAPTEPQSWNRYSYVGNRPTVLTDPTGLLWVLYNGNLYWSDLTKEQFEKKYGAVKGWRIVDGQIFFAAADKQGFRKGGMYYLNPNGVAKYIGQSTNPPMADISGLRDNSYSPFFLGMMGVYSIPVSAAAGASSVTGLVANVVKDQVADFVFGQIADAVKEGIDLYAVETRALDEAAAAKAEGVNRGAAGALTVDGDTFTGRSTGAGGGALDPRVQAAYDAIPENQRTPGFHSKCAEGRCVSAALQAGVNPNGGVIAAADIRRGVPKAPCPSCSIMLKRFGIRF
jgi:RHS repeat-associated protein